MRLLKLQAWKLFVLMVIPAIGGAIGLLISTFLVDANPAVLVTGQILTFIFLGVFVYWIYSLATHLARLTPNQSFSLSPFKWALMLSTLYRVAIDAYTLWYNASHQAHLDLESSLWVVPFHLLATGAALYCFYTDARLLVSAEKKRPSGFNDVWRTFGLILLFPIGLWFIQPRVQKLFAAKST